MRDFFVLNRRSGQIEFHLSSLKLKAGSHFGECGCVTKRDHSYGLFGHAQLEIQTESERSGS